MGIITTLTIATTLIMILVSSRVDKPWLEKSINIMFWLCVGLTIFNVVVNL